jgi:predicted MPP superfamily phosphohydrolase
VLVVLILRRLLLFSVIGGPQWFWFSRASRITARWQSRMLRSVARIALVLAIIAIIAVLYDRIFAGILPAELSAWAAPLIELWIFTSIVGFLWLMLLRFIVAVSSAIRRTLSANAPQSPDPDRRAILRYAVSIAGSVPFIAALYGYVIERHAFEIVRVDVPLANLPMELDGLRIVQLSDIHAGDLFPISELRRAISIANQLGAHLAVITGDFISGRGDPLAECIGELSTLRAPLGIWGCNGNHEIYAGAEDEAERLFAAKGMRLLRNSAAQIRWNGADLNLIGVDYQHVPFTGSTMPDLPGIERLVRRDMPNVLLSHNPNTFYRAAERGIELSLAGHTHGGQVNVEILHSSWNAAQFITKFVAGLYEQPIGTKAGGSSAAAKIARLYVSRGLGTLGLPARIGAAPEITLLTLHSD